MSDVTCPKCGKQTKAGGVAGFAIWQIVLSICLFPIGLLALLAGKQPVTCSHCNQIFKP